MRVCLRARTAEVSIQPDIRDPDWGSELNSGNRSWELRDGHRGAGGRGGGGGDGSAGRRDDFGTHREEYHRDRQQGHSELGAEGGGGRDPTGFGQTGGPLHPLQEQSFESLSSMSERERPGGEYHDSSALSAVGASMHSTDLRPSAMDDAAKRLAATEMKVESLLREMEKLKATGMGGGAIAAAAVASNVEGAAVDVGRAVVVKGSVVTATTVEATPVKSTGVGALEATQTPKVWLTPSGAAISLSTTGMPLLQAGHVTSEEGTQFPEPTPPATPDVERQAAQQAEEAQKTAKAEKDKEEKKKRERRRALTTTAWISFADDDPEERFDYCGEMVSSDRHGFGITTWNDGSSYPYNKRTHSIVREHIL